MEKEDINLNAISTPNTNLQEGFKTEVVQFLQTRDDDLYETIIKENMSYDGCPFSSRSTLITIKEYKAQYKTLCDSRTILVQYLKYNGLYDEVLKNKCEDIKEITDKKIRSLNKLYNKRIRKLNKKACLFDVDEYLEIIDKISAGDEDIKFVLSKPCIRKKDILILESSKKRADVDKVIRMLCISSALNKKLTGGLLATQTYLDYKISEFGLPLKQQNFRLRDNIDLRKNIKLFLKPILETKDIAKIQKINDSDASNICNFVRDNFEGGVEGRKYGVVKTKSYLRFLGISDDQLKGIANEEDKIEKALLKNRLDLQEERVLDMRYGISDRSYTVKEISSVFNLSFDDVRNVEKNAVCKLYDLYNSIKDRKTDCDNNEQIKSPMIQLSDIQKDILKSRYGSKKLSLEQIGKKYKLTRERIRQIQEAAINKILYELDLL